MGQSSKKIAEWAVNNCLLSVEYIKKNLEEEKEMSLDYEIPVIDIKIDEIDYLVSLINDYSNSLLFSDKETKKSSKESVIPKQIFEDIYWIVTKRLKNVSETYNEFLYNKDKENQMIYDKKLDVLGDIYEKMFKDFWGDSNNIKERENFANNHIYFDGKVGW